MIENAQREVFMRNLNNFMGIRGIRQADIAQKLGRTPSIVSDWCKGAKYPRPEAMQELSELLGVRISDLTEDKNGNVLVTMNDDEKELLMVYRGLSRQKKHILMAELYELEKRD